MNHGPHGNEIPELLAPAGNWDCARAAVVNGANAIYFGLDRFNARLRADNFSLDDLPKVMRFLHSHGVKGYVTMNTLIFTDELSQALDYLAALNAAEVDGVIVQDAGLAWILTQWRRHDPLMRLELHASTQMTISSGEALGFVTDIFDLDRVVLARELSLSDIGKCTDLSDMPLEVFVHGALCVAYSGQCLTSESLGQRSANRGECAQACRMPYRIVVDGTLRPMGERRYLLSPQDLCAVDRIHDLVKLGVKSYKIEGRLKSPEYVAAVTRAYRKALDAAMADLPVDQTVMPDDRYAMQMVFSRGFSTGWLDGADHPRLTHGRHGKKRGLYMGAVKAVGSGWVEVTWDESVNDMPAPVPGDGFVLDAGEDRNEEQGGRIWKVEGNRLYFHGKGSRIDWRDVHAGQKIWKTDDPHLNGALQSTWAHVSADAGREIDVVCRGEAGVPLEVSCAGVTVYSDALLEPARQHALTADVLAKQLGRLGNTGYRLRSCISEVQGEVMLPLSVLNQTRRLLVKALDQQGVEQTDIPIASVPDYRMWLSVGNHDEEVNCNDSALSVLCRKLEQVSPAVEHGIRRVYLDFEDVRQYNEGITIAHSCGAEVFLATPRIQKPDDVAYFSMIEQAKPDGVLVRNWGAMAYFKDKPLKRVGDFSLNAANPISARVLCYEAKLEHISISYDLNAEQVEDLLRSSDCPSMYELTIHQHMPMFHMEHCVFCSFLSKGNNYKNCGRPCEQLTVELEDRVGQRHPLLADAGCRNTVFNGRAQTGAAYADTWKHLGLTHYRIELLHERADDVRDVVQTYRRFFDGEITSDQLIDHLQVINRPGVTQMR